MQAHRLAQFIVTIFLIVALFLIGCASSGDSSDGGNVDNEDNLGPTNPAIVINNGDSTTDTATVSLSLSASDDAGVTAYYVSESSDQPIVDGNEWIAVTASKNYSESVSFTLSTDGIVTVYAWFKDGDDKISARASDSIEYITPGFDIGTLSGNTSEEAATATFIVKLNTQPNGNVEIDVVSSDDSEGTVSPLNLTFNETDWNTAQTVTVTGVNDSTNDGNQNYSIQLGINSGSTTDTTGYLNVGQKDIAIANYDDEWKLSDTGQTDSYTATFGEDSDYSINPPSFTDNKDITDNNTDLVWQKKDDGNKYSWSEAGTYCDNLTLNGQNDWRLPDMRELISIVNYKTSPAIDTAYFLKTSTDTDYAIYWTSDVYAGDTDQAWFVNFDNGQTHWNIKENEWGYFVRCVRGVQKSSNFTDNGDSTVTDNLTGLIWQQGDSGDLDTSLDDAIDYCEGLNLAGQTDWRLPNIRELESIVDVSESSPAIDTTYFAGTNNALYWSSTSLSDDTEVWTVNFGYGSVDVYDNAFYARCVRGGL